MKDFSARKKVKDASIKQKEHDLEPVYQVALEMYSRGYSIKMIDLEKSDASDYIIDGDSLIPPFTALDGLGISIAQTIVEARNKRPFSSEQDLLDRTKINKTQFSKLKSLGVLKNIQDVTEKTDSLFD
jgi:DNA polymerase-3 subunit alpha (Gram-positive type)